MDINEIVMKKIFNTWFYLFIFSSIFICCTKEKKSHHINDFVTGKIKYIKLRYNNTNSEFLLLYDSTNGRLKEIMLDTLIHARISDKINNYIIIDYNTSPTDVNPNAKIRLKAYIDDNNFIRNIVKVDTITLVESSIISFFNTNGYPDSILENPLVIITNFKLYDFKFYSNNISKVIRSYNNLITGFHVDSIFFYYTNKEQSQPQIPSQKIYSHNRIQGFGGSITTDPVYLLEINGYKCYKDNTNLIDSIYTINGSGINSITKYKYVYNGNKITEMQIKDNTEYSYIFEYY